MRKLTRQDIFDKVWRHAVIEKNPKSIGLDNQCMYRTNSGDMCFVGVCIPDDLYQESFEGYDGDRVMDVIGNKIFDKRSVDGSFLCDLQGIHDQSNVHQWEEHLRKFADKYRLTLPDPPQTNDNAGRRNG